MIIVVDDDGEDLFYCVQNQVNNSFALYLLMVFCWCCPYECVSMTNKINNECVIFNECVYGKNILELINCAISTSFARFHLTHLIEHYV